MMRGRRRTEGAVLIAMVLAACDRLPALRVPQVEQASEAVQGSGERYRTHRGCAATAKSADDLIRCMHDAGWEFLTRTPGYPEAECWQARDHGDIDHIGPLCFARPSGHSAP